MRITVLGAGDAFGSGGRRQSAYLVETSSSRFLLDAGPTLLAGLHEIGLTSKDVDFIVLSHLHGDHFGGIPFLLLDSTYESARDRELVVAGPPGTPERVQSLFAAMYKETSSRELPFRLRYVILDDGQPLEIDDVRIEPFHVPHQIVEPSFGLRVESGGKVLVYSGDSAWTDTFVERTRDADLFLCECTYWECDAPIHVNYRELSANLSRLGARRVLLTHLGRRVLDHLDEIEVETAHDGMVVEL